MEQWLHLNGLEIITLKSDGRMATNEWIGRYYVDGSGRWAATR